MGRLSFSHYSFSKMFRISPADIKTTVKYLVDFHAFTMVDISGKNIHDICGFFLSFPSRAVKRGVKRAVKKAVGGQRFVETHNFVSHVVP